MTPKTPKLHTVSLKGLSAQIFFTLQDRINVLEDEVRILECRVEDRDRIILRLRQKGLGQRPPARFTAKATKHK